MRRWTPWLLLVALVAELAFASPAGAGVPPNPLPKHPPKVAGYVNFGKGVRLYCRRWEGASGIAGGFMLICQPPVAKKSAKPAAKKGLSS